MPLRSKWLNSTLAGRYTPKPLFPKLHMIPPLMVHTDPSQFITLGIIIAVGELFPWTLWCYRVHPKLWHPMGHAPLSYWCSTGDPLGPFLFSLVLHRLILKITEDHLSGDLLFNKWDLDDGTLAGTSCCVKIALDLISSLGPSLGLYINFKKCEVFGKEDLSAFLFEITKRSHTPHLQILGAPIGHEIFCNKFVAQKQSNASFLLHQLHGLEYPQVALALLRKCAAFCKMSHISRVTPPTLIKPSLSLMIASITVLHNVWPSICHHKVVVGSKLA